MYRNRKKGRASLEKNSENQSTEKTPEKKLVMKGISLVAVIFASCCSIYFAREWGKFQTQDQREYWVVEENGRQFAVVDTYKEYMI